MADDLPTFSAGNVAGATVQHQYMGRVMKCYPVNEAEMRMLGLLGSATTAFFSLAGIAAGYAASIWINAAFAAKLTDAARVAAVGVAPVSALVALLFIALGIIAALQGKGLWGKIEREAYIIQAAVPQGQAAV